MGPQIHVSHRALMRNWKNTSLDIHRIYIVWWITWREATREKKMPLIFYADENVVPTTKWGIFNSCFCCLFLSFNCDNILCVSTLTWGTAPREKKVCSAFFVVTTSLCWQSLISYSEFEHEPKKNVHKKSTHDKNVCM